jgi:hypothetical protein
MNKKTIYLSNDSNHQLKFIGSTNSFGGYTTDGPGLIGWSGVLLGTRYGGDNVQLVSDTSGITINGKLKINTNYAVVCPTVGVKIAYGKNTDGTSSGNQSYGTTFTSTPFVLTQIESLSNYQIFQCHVGNVTTTQFDYRKVYQQGSSTNQASSEGFWWFAIGT